MIYKKIDISESVFYNVSEDAAKELIDWRASTKMPLTQRAFKRALQEAQKCEQLDICPDDAIALCIDKGWRGVVYEYVASEQRKRAEALSYETSGRNTARPNRSERADADLWEYLNGASGAGVDNTAPPEISYFNGSKH